MKCSKLHEARRKFMLANTPTDRIIEEYECRDYSEFVTSAGGDVTVYRVYGNAPDRFNVGIH